MDKWNRDGLDSYTGMTVQRRNRRRTGGTPEAPKEAEKPEEAAVPEEPVIPAEVTAGPEKQATQDIPAVKPETTERAVPEPGEADEEPVKQGPDSRVPAEARRMAAAPYGEGGSALAPTGPQPRVSSGARPVRTGEVRSEGARTGAPRTGTGPRPEGTGARPGAGPQRRPGPRVNVHIGYAPGRMNDEETRQIPSEKAVRESIESVYGRDAKAYLEKRKNPFREEENGNGAPPPTGGRALRAAVAFLIVIGLMLTGWLLLKDRDAKKGQTVREAPQVISFEPPDTEGIIAPADLTFSAVTGKDVEGIRLRAEGDEDLDTVATCADNADEKLWMMSMHVESGFEGTVMLQVRRAGEETWYDTEYTAEVNVSNTPAAEIQGSKKPEGDSEEKNDDYYNEDELKEKEPDAEATEEPEGEPTGEPLVIVPEATEEPEEEEDDWVEGEEELPMGELKTPEPTPEPETVTPEPTETPALEAVAAEEADPSIITNVTVWTSVTKKEKNYTRLAKEQIHMPDADHYTPRQFGVMTFRGDNFRRNAAAGSMSAAAVGLQELWKVEGGSARGVKQTYYGYGWPGQPAIARWTTEIKAKTNIEDDKKASRALKEVIIAGLDGNIKFLDLADGKFTRGSIKLGYAMRGTPSLHTQGYPFMAVGQYARKMRNKTGMIGMRQYTLYNQEATKVIDGLDGKYHRPENDVGSFETSALIDYTSDTLICVGTNGALYLESLGSTFDYNQGIMKISPSFTVMTNKVKGVKNKALLAVESSPAAYDKYVFYADMGGVLRCVDTNTLTPVWAVKTGDSVMAAVALDLTAQRDLNLYTANMLNNRKKGNSTIQIRRYDALSGKETWCTEVGVYKGKKDKADVGAKASPIIGQNALGDLVYFTVTGLSEEGRAELGLTGEEVSALIAMDKDTGKVQWTFGMDSRSESSPVAVYDKQGNGWIVQCEQSGIMHLLEGRTGAQVSSMDLEAQIEASPAAYNNVVVIGTTGKGTSYVYGIQIVLDKSAGSETEGSAGNEAGEDAAEGGSESEAGDGESEENEENEYDAGGEEEPDGVEETEYEDYGEEGEG